VSGRQLSLDTPLSILAHEAGHRFLAFASVRDPEDPDSRPMLGFQGAHWSFVFNSEASLLEGNRIRDNQLEPQPGIISRFSTIGVTEAFSLLDQYLMGFRAAEEVKPIFVATSPSVSPLQQPRLGVNFNGGRRDISVEDIIAAEGRRTPDHTVAQRRFRFAFVLIVPDGVEPTSESLQKINTFRQQFEMYFHNATGQRAWADTSLRRALRLSLWPAAGVLQGGEVAATVSVQKPADAPIVVYLRTRNGVAGVPSQVTIPSGASQTAFTVSGLRPGVEELSAEPADPGSFETAYARIQVRSSAAELKLVVASGAKQAATPGVALPQPVVLRAVDVNNLPYQGLRVNASVAGGGALGASTAVTDENGAVGFAWTPGAGPVNQITATLAGAEASSGITVAALGKPLFASASVVNAASYEPGLSPGGLATIFGSNLAAGETAEARAVWPTELAGVTVTVNGRRAPLLMVSDGQVNFLVPADTAQGTASLVITTTLGASSEVRAPVHSVSPGIFFDVQSGTGAVVVAGSAETTGQRPATGGDYLEIYATGLGSVRSEGGLRWTVAAPRVFIGGLESAAIGYSGLAPGYDGLYQVNARVPDGAPSGWQDLSLEVGGKRTNTVKVRIR
jgi:uncharacterized protein (TIGR03437 family)